MANHGDGWFSSVFDFGTSILDRQPSRKRQGSMFGISAEPDEKPPPRTRALKLLQRKPSHPRKPDSASVEVPIEWDATREFILYPDGRRGLVKLPLTHLVQRPSPKMVAKIKEGELLDFLAGCKITPAVDIAHEWGLEGSIVLYDPRDPPVFCIEYVYMTDHLREESETRRNVLADPKRNLFFITLRGDDLPTYHFWQDVEKDGDPRGAVYWNTYVNGRSPGRVGQQLDDEIEVVGELHRAREPFDDEEEKDVVQTPKSKDDGLVNGIIDETSGEDSTALDELAFGEQNKLISLSTPKPTTTSDDELGLTELFGSVYDSDEEFDSDEGSEWDENFGFDSDDGVDSNEDAESDEDYMPEGVVLHRGRSSHGFDPSVTYYYRCPPGLAERRDRELNDLIETWEDNLRVRGLASTLEGFSEYQPGGDDIWHFGGGDPPDEPPRRRWPPGRAIDTVAYKLAIASKNGGPVQRLIGDEPWTRNDNIGFWNGNYQGMYYPLEDYTPDYHRQSTNVRGMETKRRYMFQPSFNDGEQLSDLVDTRNPWRSGPANTVGDHFSKYLPSPTSDIFSPMDFQHDGPNVQPQRGYPSIRDSIITSYDENGDPRDSDYDVVMTDPLHRQRKQSQVQTDPGYREIKLYDGRVNPNALPNPSRPFRVWNWHGLTSNEKDRKEQAMAFWTIVSELIFEGEEVKYVIKLKAYNDDGTEPEDWCRLMNIHMAETIFENRMSEYLSDPARNEVYLVPAPDALEDLDRKIEEGIGIPIFTQSGAAGTGDTLHRLRGSNSVDPPFVPTDCRDCGSCLTSPIAYAAHHIEHFKGRTASPQELHPEVQQALKRARFRHFCRECGLDLTEVSTFGFAMHRRGHEQQRSARSGAMHRPPTRPSGKRVAFGPARGRGRGKSPRPNTGATREEDEEEQGLGGRLWQLLSGVYSASVGRVRSASAPPAPLTSSSVRGDPKNSSSSPHVYRGYPRKLFPGPTPPPNSFDQSYLKNARSIRPLPYPPRSFPPPAANSFFPRATRATSLPPPKSRSDDDDDDDDDEGSSIASSLHRRRKGGHNHQDGTNNNNNGGGGVKNWFSRVFNRDDQPTSPPPPPYERPPLPPAGLLSPRTAAARRARLGGEEILTAPHEIAAARAAELRLRADIDQLRWVHYLLPALQWGGVTAQHLVDRRNEMRLEEMRREAGGGDEAMMAEGWLRRRAEAMYERERGIYKRRKEEEVGGGGSGGPFSDAELRFKWHRGNFQRLQDFSLVVECRKMRGEESDGKAEFPDWELAWYAERAKERKGPGEYGEGEGKEHHRWRLILRRERLKKEWARRHPGWDESQETEPYQEGVMPTRWDRGIIRRKPVGEPPRPRQRPTSGLQAATGIRRKPVGEPPRRSQQLVSGPGPARVVRRKPVGSGVGPVLHRRRSPTVRYHPYAFEAASPEHSPVRRIAPWRRVRSREGDGDALAEGQQLRHGEIVPLRLSHAIATGQPMAIIEEEWLPAIRRSPNLTRFWVLLIKELERYEQQRAESEEEKRQARQQTRRRSGVVLGEVANGSDSGIELTLVATQRKKADGNEQPPKPLSPPTAPPMLSTTPPKPPPRLRAGLFRGPPSSRRFQKPTTEEVPNDGDEATRQTIVNGTKTTPKKATEGKQTTATTTSPPTPKRAVRRSRQRRQSITERPYRPVAESDDDTSELGAGPTLHEPEKVKETIKKKSTTPTPRKTKPRRMSFSSGPYKPTADEGDDDEDKELTQAIIKELEQAKKLSKKRKHGSDVDGTYRPSKTARVDGEDSEEYVEQPRTKKSSEESRKSKEPTGIKKTVTIEVASEPATKAAPSAETPASPAAKKANVKSADEKRGVKKVQRVTGKGRGARSGSPSPESGPSRSTTGYSLRSRQA